MYHADRFRVRRRPGAWAACWEEGVLCAIAVHSGCAGGRLLVLVLCVLQYACTNIMVLR